MSKSNKNNFRQGHCEECLACSILQDNSLVSSEAFVGDMPDIIDGNEGIEVTSAISDEIENQLSFGLLPKEEEYTNVTDYSCTACEFLPDCREAYQQDPCVRCKKCEVSSWLRDYFIVVARGSAFYVGGDHPEAIGWTASSTGLLEEITNAIKKKENKAQNYSQSRLSLFLYYNKDVAGMEEIQSDVFSNIYIYCLNNGKLYKNEKLIKHYPRINLNNYRCCNRNCINFGKFN